jgi:hypothetical protein
VYVFDRDGRIASVLTVPHLDPEDPGVASVAINDSLAVVGGAGPGVYAFDVASDRNWAGRSVALSGDRVVVVGGPGGDVVGVYTR